MIYISKTLYRESLTWLKSMRQIVIQCFHMVASTKISQRLNLASYSSMHDPFIVLRVCEWNGISKFIYTHISVRCHSAAMKYKDLRK